MIIGNNKSCLRPVLSGVPQGSIIGPILFVLFINDIASGLTKNTNLALYADDTKIWRTIYSEIDHDILQSDINYLYNWSIKNKMKFHPNKCKVLSVSCRPPPFIGMLPNIQYFYHLGEDLLDYAENERDLGVDINSKLDFNIQCERVLNKARQKLGMIRRTCHFVNVTKRRRVLYLSLIRSVFEHCSQIWRPNGKVMLQKFESFQKNCLKWILSEEFLRYGTHNNYVLKCRQVNILPLAKVFDLNDLVLIHKIIYELIPTRLPRYMHLFSGLTRLRSTHLDTLCLVNDLQLNRYNEKYLNRSFFFRAHLLWNKIPYEIRKITDPSFFKVAIIEHFWKHVLDEIDISDDFYSLDTFNI